MKFTEAIQHIEEQLQDMLGDIQKEKIDEMIDYFFTAHNIFVYGAGRSGLVGKAFAIRLVHLGFPAFVVGETITRPVTKNDLVILISSTGETIPVAMTAEIARRLGAKLISITSNADSHIARFADLLIILSPKNKNAELAPLGTLFEAAAWIFLDAIVAELMAKKGENEKNMRQRHATLE
ncbi:MAG: iron dicitrate transport regulator FecR [Thermoplasmata archaeon]|nr:MAG: iron dicitrate transport regulator FecR [Thermoplasmata archaeon]RLF39989.1 MAG: iron dicitrate transport regulator FecR [Thermoplasmata archaeon]